MEKCIRCGKPCNNGENMCDECRAWFQEKTGGSTPASGSKVTKKSETIAVKDIAQPFYGVWVLATKNESEAEKMCNELITKGFDPE